MKKFLVKLLLLLLLTSLTVFWLPMLFIAPQFLGFYSASLYKKAERLETMDEPKIVLIGNSNLTFGMDSQLLSELTGMPVMNMGFHGGMSNAFHERMARINTNEGDIVIVCHTTYADDGTISIPWLIWPTIENHYPIWRLLGPSDIVPTLNSYPRYLKDILNLWYHGTGNQPYNSATYCAAAVNEWGDISVPRETEGITGELPYAPPEINDICARRMNRLNRYVTRRGATLLVAGAPVCETGTPGEKAALAKASQTVDARLNCDVISDFSDYLYPPELFFDTREHLTTEGAELRTRQLASDIFAWRAGQNGA